MRLERALLVLALGFGAAYATTTPPFQVPDEPHHFFRAFEVSELRVLPRARNGEPGALLPRSLPRVAGALADEIPFHADRKFSPASIRVAARQRLETDERVFVPFLTALYGFAPYVPAALGIRIARAFSDSVLVLFYAGRFASLFASTLLIVAAVRRTPAGKPAFFLLSIAPMAMFEMASISGDGVTDAYCFFFAATALARALDGSSVRRRDFVRFVALGGLLGLMKPAYVLLPGLLLLAPKGGTPASRRRNALAAATLAGALVASVAWALAIRSLDPPFPGVGGADPARQLRAVWSDPLGTATRIAAFYVHAGPSLGNQYVGKLGWIDTALPPAFVVLFAASLAFVGITGGAGADGWSVRQRLVLAAVLLGGLVWLTAVLYAVLTPVGAAYVGSTQGRYFIPFGPIALLLIGSRRLRIDWTRHAPALVAWAVATQLVSLGALARRFYA